MIRSIRLFEYNNTYEKLKMSYATEPICDVKDQISSQKIRARTILLLLLAYAIKTHSWSARQ